MCDRYIYLCEFIYCHSNVTLHDKTDWVSWQHLILICVDVSILQRTTNVVWFVEIVAVLLSIVYCISLVDEVKICWKNVHNFAVDCNHVTSYCYRRCSIKLKKSTVIHVKNKVHSIGVLAIFNNCLSWHSETSNMIANHCKIVKMFAADFHLLRLSYKSCEQHSSWKFVKCQVVMLVWCYRVSDPSV